MYLCKLHILAPDLFDSHQQVSGIIIAEYFLGFWEGHFSSLMLACFAHSKTNSDMCLGSLSCWNTQLCVSFNYSCCFSC